MTTTRKQRDASVASVGRIGPHMQRVRAEAAAVAGLPAKRTHRQSRLILRPYVHGSEYNGVFSPQPAPGSLGFVGGFEANYGWSFDAFRWPDVATVTSATVKMTQPSSETGTASMQFSAEDASSPVKFSATHLPSALTETTAKVTLTAVGDWATIDVTAIINELIASYGRGRVANLNLMVNDTGAGPGDETFNWTALPDLSLTIEF